MDVQRNTELVYNATWAYKDLIIYCVFILKNSSIESCGFFFYVKEFLEEHSSE